MVGSCPTLREHYKGRGKKSEEKNWEMLPSGHDLAFVPKNSPQHFSPTQLDSSGYILKGGDDGGRGVHCSLSRGEQRELGVGIIGNLTMNSRGQ